MVHYSLGLFNIDMISFLNNYRHVLGGNCSQPEIFMLHCLMESSSMKVSVMASTCKDLEMFRIIIFGVLILCKPTKMKMMKVSSLQIFFLLKSIFLGFLVS